MFKLKNKKGVSPVIAVVLMVAVAVALAVIIYAWASGYISGEVGKARGSTAYNFVIEEQSGVGGAVVTISIRNTGLDVTAGCTTLQGFDWYENGVYRGYTGITCAIGTEIGDAGVWEKGEVWQFTFTKTTGNWTSGDEAKLVHTASGYEMTIVIK